MKHSIKVTILLLLALGLGFLTAWLVGDTRHLREVELARLALRNDFWLITSLSVIYFDILALLSGIPRTTARRT